MTFIDRLLPLTELLMGAAYADDQLTANEREEVRALLIDLLGGPLPAEVESRIVGFWPASFDLAAAAAPFLRDAPEVRRRLLFLVGAVIEADDAVDVTEQDYVTELCQALELPPDALIGMPMQAAATSLQAEFAAVRYGQPPDDHEFDVELDDD